MMKMLVVSLVKSSPFILVFGEIVDGKMKKKDLGRKS